MSRWPARSRDRSVQLFRSQIAQRLLDSGREVRTLTYHPDRAHPLRAHVEPVRYRFDDPAALARSLEGCDTLYNTFWVRFDHGQTSFANAIESSRMLFFAAKRAGVQRIVHLSITNPSSGLPAALLPRQGAGRVRARPVRRAVLDRPADLDLRRRARRPDQQHRLDPAAHAGLCAARRRRATPCSRCTSTTSPGSAPRRPRRRRRGHRRRRTGDDAVPRSRGAGPRRRRRARADPATCRPRVMAAAARALGLLVRDVVLTRDEIRGLMAGLLVSHDPPLGQIAFSQWLDEHAARSGAPTPTSCNATSPPLSAGGGDRGPAWYPVVIFAPSGG